MINPLRPDYSATPAAPQRPTFGYRSCDVHAGPAATIVTPFYNTGTIFHETAHTVLHQSFQQWEWLIVNDGSTDSEALAILDTYRNYDPRIRVIDHPVNQGLSAARNTGFRTANTPYVLQLDSDDLIEPTALEQWIWFLETHPEYAFVKGYSVGFGALEYLWEKGFHLREVFLHENVVTPTALIRTTAYQAASGYDEAIRHGCEDWDFWLRCAHAGQWGATVPEYLDWYRRRPSHGDRWSTWDEGERQHQFRSDLHRKYADLLQHGFPHIESAWHLPYADVSDELPFLNKLMHQRPRLLLLIPWMTLGGADKFNLDLVRLLVERHGYEVTIATTMPGQQTWAPLFAQHTPDIFILDHFLPLVDQPRFLHYLIQSRQIDTVLISNSYLSYQLLPYLRSHHPDVPFVDYLHMEEENWKNGGYPRASLTQAEQLDLTITVSNHLKEWLVERGGDATRIEVCTVNVDSTIWDPARFDRPALRRELGVGDDEVVILYAGRICPQKQPRLFAEVMLRLTQRRARFTCFVAGDGEDRQWLEQFIAKHNLHQIRMLGSVPPERMPSLVAASDILFLPSEMEGISIAIYEAMSMEVVPVGADVGGQRELVTPECGVLVEHGPGEASAYEMALLKLIADGAVRRRMGQAARARIRTSFDLPQMGERMVQLLDLAHDWSHRAPRPNIPWKTGLATATHVIEQTRLERIADRMWAEREALLARSPHLGELRRYLLLWGARSVKRTMRPLYRWALAHGMHWLVPLRDRVRAQFLPRI